MPMANEDRRSRVPALLPVPAYVRFLALMYLTGLAGFTLFRAVLLIRRDLPVEHFRQYWPMALQAFGKGLQFDSVVMGYLLLLPALYFITCRLLQTRPRALLCQVYFIVVFVLSFLIAAADIPYFFYHAARLSAVVFNWGEDAGTLGTMILRETSYRLYAVLWIIQSGIGIGIVRRKTGFMHDAPAHRFSSWAWMPLTLFLLFVMCRGRIDSPIKVSTAFFSNNPFYNQLGLNPVFTLMRSLQDKRSADLMPEAEAFRVMRSSLGLPPTGEASLTRPYTFPDSAVRCMNVVLVLMESMSAQKLRHFGSSAPLTPFLDSMAEHALCFDRIYSTGRHTYNGIFSTLYGYPAILAEHPMSSTVRYPTRGLPAELQEAGYHNLFFTTHDPSFDNLAGFLPEHGIQHIIGQNQYPQSELLMKAFGVPDHVMFQCAVDTLDQLSRTGQPFFATLMTVSDHPPYVLPGNIPFRPRSTELPQQIVEYADWALGDFFRRCAEKPWFSNTVFVFVADHGAVVGEQPHEIPLSYHHIPALIYSAAAHFPAPGHLSEPASQADLGPTILHLLRHSFRQTTPAIDLLQEHRPYAVFSADDRIGCIDSTWFYVYNLNGEERLYRLNDASCTDLKQQEALRAKAMRDYAFALIRSSKALMDASAASRP